MKAKLIGVLGLFIAPPATIFTLLSFQDKGLKVMNIEGSGSLYEPILLLTKDHKLNTELNVLPTGSAGGKEALNNKSSDLALTSLSTKENSVPKEAKLAEDPIYLVHKKGTKCSTLNSNVESQTQNDLFTNLFKRENGCKDFVLFLREGGHERSNLNKTVITQEQLKELGITVRELPENNFLAYERFSREAYADSIIFFPHSFIELNKDLFSDYEQKKLNGNSKADSPKLKKELNLLFNTEKAGENSELKQLITKILGGSEGLKKKVQAYTTNLK